MPESLVPDSRAFAYARFKTYALALLAAHTALNVQITALGWHIYTLTRDPLDLGLVGLLEFLPAPVLVLLSGHAADRMSRTHLVAMGYMVQALCSLALLLMVNAHIDSVGWLLCVVLVVGSARSFHGPAARAVVPNLVALEALPNAVAWRASLLQIAMVTGPMLGGWLYTVHPSLVFGVCMLLQIVACTAMSRIALPAAAGPTQKTTWKTLTAGIAFIRNSNNLLGAISLDLFAVLFGGATALLPIYAHDILLTGPTGLGWLRSAGAAGATMTALYLVNHAPQTRLGKTLYGVIAVYGAAIIGFGLSTSFWLAMVFLFVAGAADMVSMYIRSALVPLLTPDGMRGRVTAVEMVFIGASNELGAFESGLAARIMGPVAAVVSGGVATLVVTVAWTRLFSGLYAIDTLDDLTPSPAAADHDPNRT